MDYELAKKLKDAGFAGTIEYVKTPFDDIVPNPTLEEIIEAFGNDEWLNLHFYPKAHGLKWEAMRANPKFQRTLDIIDENFVQGGSTPKEAMAKLWLALNNNKVL